MSEVLDGQSVVDPVAPTPEEIAAFEAESQSNSTPSPEQKQEIQKQIEKLEKTFKLKVNGKEIEEKIDLNDEARIIKALQMEKASQEAFQRAAAKEKELAAMNAQLDQFFELLKSNPLEVLMNKELGLNAEELANKILDMKIEDELKSPEQKALEEARAKLEEYERKEKEAREEAERLKTEKMQAEFEKEITNSISEAIDKGDLPKSPYIVAKFAQLLDITVEKGLDVKPQDLIPIVKNAYMRDMRDMINRLPDEVIEDMVTTDRIKTIRNNKIQALKKSTEKLNNPVKVEETARQDSKPVEKKKEDFFKKLGAW